MDHVRSLEPLDTQLNPICWYNISLEKRTMEIMRAEW